MSDFYAVENFLSKNQIENLLQLVKENKENFENNVLDKKFFKTFFTNFLDKIYSLLPIVSLQLSYPFFLPENIDVQICVSNHSFLFEISHKIKFVLFFNREPKNFEHGQLKLYSTDRAQNFITIEPENNTIIFFKNTFIPEIVPIKAENFVDSGFTVCGCV